MYADKNILYFIEASGDAVFNYNEMGIVNIDLNNINRDNDFDEDDPILLFLPDFWLGMLSLKNPKNLTKNKWKINCNSVASR